ncbi:hypothetical protein M9Y10_006584 [Tritrichomonas musculus]|uniref:Myb-like DNA-binding domain containing protein n=1 Tax=Tritrichomonas musculus TaxID=1915356 RepID=A0ABR2JF29_9EUKA
MNGGRMRMKFTEIDDIKLIKIVKEQQQVEWKKVSLLMGKYTPRQCRDRYNNYLSPNVQNKKWSKEEEQLLLEKYSVFGPKWSFLSQFFQNRAAVNIKNHYTKLSMKSLLKEESSSTTSNDSNDSKHQNNNYETKHIDKTKYDADIAEYFSQLESSDDFLDYSFESICNELFII